MLWIWFIGLVLLLVGILSFRQNPPGLCRIRLPRRMIGWLKRTARIASDDSLEALSPRFRPLAEQICRLQTHLRHAPVLPMGTDHAPRLMDLAQALSDEGVFTQAALCNALANWEYDATPSEAATLPLCVAAVQCYRLAAVLKAICADVREQRCAVQLARRIEKSRRPEKALLRVPLRGPGLSCLLRLSQDAAYPHLQALLAIWLAEQGLSSEELSRRALERQLQFAEELRRAESCFSALEKMNWLPLCETVDGVHQLLLDDPDAVYPKLTSDSRYALRLQIEALSRHMRLPMGTVIQAAMQLSREVEKDSLERCVAYWFQDRQGLKSLFRALPAKRGLVYSMLLHRQAEKYYWLLWLLSFVAGFLFLQSGEPVFMLPFLLLTFSAVSRRLLSKPVIHLPQYTLDSIPSTLKTLVLLPVLLTDPQEAIRLVRHMKITMQAIGDANADFLLLGDFSPNMTAVSSSDALIIQTAVEALAAIQTQQNALYFQRSRTWNGERHRYQAHDGRAGAVRTICRLIAQGECEDVFAFTSSAPACLERKYGYVLVIPPEYQVVPGMYQQLLQTMVHPLQSRYPTPDGWRGFSILTPENCPRDTGMALIRPDTFLEATDSLVFPHTDGSELCGELAGQACVKDAFVQKPLEVFSWAHQYRQACQAWQLSPWQLPLVRVPAGIIRNPLNWMNRFHLRETLRKSLEPLGQIGLLLYAVLTQRWLLLLLSLLPDFTDIALRRKEDLIKIGCLISLLPMRMFLRLRAIWDVMLHRTESIPPFDLLEVWVQGIAAALFTGLGIALPSFAVPVLSLGVLFACFPLAHKGLSADSATGSGLTEGHFAFLERIARSTWHYFHTYVTAENHFLPPQQVQFDPPLGSSAYTTPEGIAAYLLACVCAKDLGYLSAEEAAQALQNTIDTCASLPLAHGLPCRRWALPALTIENFEVDARSTGILLAALLTSAQAVRSWLPELSPKYANLSARIQHAAERFDLASLYDADCDLFYESLDTDGVGVRHIDAFTDEALLLSVSAYTMGKIPAMHFRRLKKTAVQLRKYDLPLSRHGAASSHLLSGLFLPIDSDAAAAFIHAMAQAGDNGLFGQDACGLYAFDPGLQYQKAIMGVQSAAFAPLEQAKVFTPYAAALALPFLPADAAAALACYSDHGALGPDGFCDAIDCTAIPTLIGLQQSDHQGWILSAAAHLLADTPIRRYFSSLPSIEACLPLLANSSFPLVLPNISIPRSSPKRLAPCETLPIPQRFPAPGHLLGSPEFHMTVNAMGSCAMYDGCLPLLHLPKGSNPAGLLFYLVDDGQVHRLGDPTELPEAIFAPGEMRLEQICGSFRAELVCFVDTIRRRCIHLITVTNLSTQDKLFDLADYLQPDLAVSPSTFEASQEDTHSLTLLARGTDVTLHHRWDASMHPLSANACTDSTAFLGRRGSVHHPAALEDAPRSQVEPTTESILSFRLKFSLGGRSQISAWFTTALNDHRTPQFSEISGLRSLAAMQHHAIASAIRLDERQWKTMPWLLGLLPQSKNRICLFLYPDDPDDVLLDIIHLFKAFHLQGLHASLHLICPESFLPHAKNLLAGHPIADCVQCAETCPASDDSLCLRGDTPLFEQLEPRFRSPPATRRLISPTSAQLPDIPLRFSGRYGGFDPENDDFIIRLESGQTTPTPWENRHHNQLFCETVDESGFRTPFHEQVWLTLENGLSLTPWFTELPRSIRMGMGETAWEAWSDSMHIRLCAACMPGYRCGIRMLTLRNTASAPLSLSIALLSSLSAAGSLSCADGLVITDQPDQEFQAFIAASGFSAQRTHALEIHAATGHIPRDFADEPTGHTATLSREIILPAKGSSTLIWLSGYARQGEDVIRTMAALEQGPSRLLRHARGLRAAQLSRLTISTPEETLDLLMNRILPAQILSAANSTPVFPLFSAQEALRALIRAARNARSTDDWARIACQMLNYVHVTQDKSPLDLRLSDAENLYSRCAQALLSHPLDHQQLPKGEDSPRLCFMYAIAADALDQLCPNPDLQELRRTLLNAADTHLWQDSHYATPLRLDIQQLACQAYGANSRTRQAINTCWEVLYDQPHGLIRHQVAADAASLPGSPENGGMYTQEAARFLSSLLQCGQADEAFELLRALNPLHHTDAPLRQETFRAAPYLLHGGMYADPLNAGQGTAPNCEAATALYSTLLQDILGFDRSGNSISLHPHVPPEWEDYTLTLQEGASTWRITLDRRIDMLTIDGAVVSGEQIAIQDDGKVHRVRCPLI